MDVGGTAGVMTGEGGLEVNNTVGITLLNTTEEGRVDVELIGRVTITISDNAGVDTLVGESVRILG